MMMNERNTAPDVIVIGGGVVGLSIAWELAEHGASVRVLEQSQFGQEASWAGAGMLPPGNPHLANTPEAHLRAESHVLWPEWTARLREATGIDNGFARCGGLEVCRPRLPNDQADEVAAWRAEGVDVESLNHQQLRSRFPALNEAINGGYLLPELGQVRNPRHLKALHQACATRGVDLRAGTPVVDFDRREETIHSVHTPNGEHRAAEFVVAGGAWSRQLLQRAGHDLLVEPVRGQIVLLEARPLPFRCVIQVGARYLVPRADGRILIGSTEEHAGFDKRNTAGAVADLIDFAQQLVPVLSDARFERCWAGLRPFVPGGLPIIGRVPGTKNLSVAAGHFRAGLQLSPITAVLIRRLLDGRARGSSDEWADSFAPRSEVGT
jgi:glycine oxidase